MTRTQQRTQFLWMLADLLTFAHVSGIEVICFTFHRTPEEQARMVAEGKSRVVHSKHQDWLAVDLCVIKDGQAVWGDCEEYQKLGKCWKELGGTWGGDWSNPHDVYHFQYKD